MRKICGINFPLGKSGTGPKIQRQPLGEGVSGGNGGGKRTAKTGVIKKRNLVVALGL